MNKKEFDFEDIIQLAHVSIHKGVSVKINIEGLYYYPNSEISCKVEKITIEIGDKK